MNAPRIARPRDMSTPWYEHSSLRLYGTFHLLAIVEGDSDLYSGNDILFELIRFRADWRSTFLYLRQSTTSTYT